MKLFDSHAHFDDDKFNNDREQIILECKKAGIDKLVSAGYSLESSKKAIELAKTYDFIYATCGISPNDIQQEDKLWKEVEQIREIIEKASNLLNKKIVAIGEIGLDYYWEKEQEKRDLQKKVFIKQIELANILELPIVIHTRDAIEDTISILKENTVNKKGIFHCCPQNKELIKQALKLDFYISFAGPITFKNSKNAEEIINMVPNDKILIETDSPYLAPEPVRGTRNDSRNVKYVAEKIAKSKNLNLEQVAKMTYENACNAFNIGNNTL